MDPNGRGGSIETSRICPGCGLEKNFSEFYRDSRSRRRVGRCRTCKVERNRANRRARTEELLRLRALVTRLTHNDKDPAGVITTGRVAALDPKDTHQEGRACA